MKIKCFKGFLSLLFSLSLVFSACNTGGGGEIIIPHKRKQNSKLHSMPLMQNVNKVRKFLLLVVK